MGFIKGLAALWQARKWFNNFRKRVGSKTERYCTKERALRWRFQGEVWAKRIADGDLDGLPTILRWIFALTTADETLITFFQYLFKSKKIEENDEVLNQPLYRMH